MLMLCRLAVLFLSLASLRAFAFPRMISVEPDMVAPGTAAVASGSDLDTETISKVYLTSGGTDIEMKITDQTEETITFELPDSIEMKRYRLMVLTAGEGAAYMEQPVSLEVVDAETAALYSPEGEIELEIIEAEPIEEEDPQGSAGGN